MRMQRKLFRSCVSENTNDNILKKMNENDMIHWVREAAGRGDAEAAMTLGELYMKGEGVEKNEEEALAWFRKAAELKSKGSAATDAAPAPAPDPVPTTEAPLPESVPPVPVSDFEPAPPCSETDQKPARVLQAWLPSPCFSSPLPYGTTPEHPPRFFPRPRPSCSIPQVSWQLPHPRVPLLF